MQRAETKKEDSQDSMSDLMKELNALKQELAEKNRQLQERKQYDALVTELLKDPLELIDMNQPVIAADGYFYSEKSYQKLLSERNGISPFTRKNINQSPFPFIYKKLQDFISDSRDSNDTSILKDLCTDPITGKIMKTPCVAVLTIQEEEKAVTKTRVIICDKNTLEDIKNPDIQLDLFAKITVDTSRELSSLQDLIKLKQNDLVARKDLPQAKGLEWLLGDEIVTQYFVPAKSATVSAPVRTPTLPRQPAYVSPSNHYSSFFNQQQEDKYDNPNNDMTFSSSYYSSGAYRGGG